MPLDLAEVLLDHRRGVTIEGRARLVEEDRFGLRGEHPCQAQPLLLSPREREGGSVQAVAVSASRPTRVEQPTHGLLTLALVGDEAVLVQRQRDVVVRRHGERVRALEDVADPPPHLVGPERVRADHTIAAQAHGALDSSAGNELVETVERPQERGLAHPDGPISASTSSRRASNDTSSTTTRSVRAAEPPDLEHDVAVRRARL